MRKKFLLKLVIHIVLVIVFVYVEAGINGILTLCVGTLIYAFIYGLLYVIEKKWMKK